MDDLNFIKRFVKRFNVDEEYATLIYETVCKIKEENLESAMLTLMEHDSNKNKTSVN